MFFSLRLHHTYLYIIHVTVCILLCDCLYICMMHMHLFPHTIICRNVQLLTKEIPVVTTLKCIYVTHENHVHSTHVHLRNSCLIQNLMRMCLAKKYGAVWCCPQQIAACLHEQLHTYLHVCVCVYVYIPGKE